jgi:O-antigen/teichoic acid export membrane protein
MAAHPAPQMQATDIPRKTVETFLARIASQTASVLGGILLARALGPYGKGVFTYVTTTLAVLLTIGSGQSGAISWQYGRLKRPSGDVLAASRIILLVLGVALSLGVGAFAFLAPGQLPLIAVAVALPFAFFAQMSLGFFLADGKVRFNNIQSLVTSISLLIALVVALLIFHASLTVVLLIWVCVNMVTALYSTLMLRWYAGTRQGDVRPLIREQTLFGIKVSANNLITVLNFRIDVFIVLLVLGAKALGVYSIAVGAGEVLWQLSRPLGISAFGTINSGSRLQATNLTAKCVRHVFIMVALACLVLFFVGPWLITLIYGKPFAGAGVALRFLLPGIVAYSVTPFIAGFFTQQLGRPELTLMIRGLSTILCAIITLLAVRPWGIAGAAVATSVSYLITLLASLFVFCEETGMTFRSVFTFAQDDIRPYKSLLRSMWRRTQVPSRVDSARG